MADLYLSSVFEAWWHKFEGSKAAVKLFREANRTRTPAEMIRNTFRASGGVFYDGDATTDPLLAAGLKWPDLYSNCEEDVDGWPQLPVANAQALIGALEERPLTQQRYVRHLELGLGRYAPMQKFIGRHAQQRRPATGAAQC